jgi:hypothetical protein
MFKRFALVPLILLASVTFGAKQAEATIINLNATVNNADDPIELHLVPGEYFVTPLVHDPSQGIDYTAWSRWASSSGCDVDGANCDQGYENSYAFFSSLIPDTFAWNGIYYENPEQTIGNGIVSAFTLFVPQVVSFYLTDGGPLGDNRAGMSLDVSAIPEPATMSLLLTGLAAFGHRRLRRKSQ